jgi:hypothetical protein
VLAASSGATVLVVTVNSVSGAKPPSWVNPNPQSIALSTAAGGNCTISASVETCDVSVFAPPGVVSYTFTVENATEQVLSTINETFTVTQGQTALQSVMLQSIVSTVNITPPALTAGSPLSTPLAVSAADATGNIIAGTAPYNNPITLSDGDTSDATSLSVNGGASAKSVVLQSPADVVTFTYSGFALKPFMLTATANGATGAAQVTTALSPIVVTGTTPDSPANGGTMSDPNFNLPTIFFTSTSQKPQTFSASEAGWSGSPFNQLFAVALDATTCKSGANAVASVTPLSPPGGTTFTATPLNAGFCKVTVTDGLGQSSILWISVTTTSFPVN